MEAQVEKSGSDFWIMWQLIDLSSVYEAER